ncbi:MAG: formylglycine-generating enzyme family protein [Bacillota bacterium]
MKKNKLVLIMSITVVVLLINITLASCNDGIEVITPEMIKVPAGNFTMGQILSNGLRLGFPVHKVTLTNNFEMGKYEVTNEEYVSVLNYALENDYLTGKYENNDTVLNREGQQVLLIDLGANYKGYKNAISYNNEEGKFIVEKGKEKRPVVYVSWAGAAFYTNILSEVKGLEKLYNLEDWSSTTYGKNGYRLPTEAEWEYTARYDDGRTFPWGDEIDNSFINFGLNIGHTTDVDSFPEGKSKLGLYNMIGNVQEWVNDWYENYPEGEVENPTGPDDGVYKVKRGGTFYRHANNFAFSAYRYDTNYIYTNWYDVGFRIVKIKK